MAMRTSCAVALFLLCSGVGLLADRLLLRNGQEMTGRLVSVQGDVIEFEERRGFFGTRTHRIDRDDVRSIELEGSGTTRSRPAGLRERELSVAADAQWTDAGIDVRGGQDVYVEAEGSVRWGPDRRDGPGGERNSPRNPNRPIPSRAAAALIGRIGSDATDAFFIGTETGPIRMPASGRLFLGVNDDYLLDNSGSFQVTVFY